MVHSAFCLLLAGRRFTGDRWAVAYRFSVGAFSRLASISLCRVLGTHTRIFIIRRGYTCRSVSRISFSYLRLITRRGRTLVNCYEVVPPRFGALRTGLSITRPTNGATDSVPTVNEILILTRRHSGNITHRVVARTVGCYRGGCTGGAVIVSTRTCLLDFCRSLNFVPRNRRCLRSNVRRVGVALPLLGGNGMGERRARKSNSKVIAGFLDLLLLVLNLVFVTNLVCLVA